MSDAPPSADSWPAQATDLIVSTVGTVRDKTTGPAITIARGAVFGTFAAIAGLASLVFFAIFLVRIITVYMPGQRVWPADVIVGGLFVLTAFVLSRLAVKRPK